MRPEVGRVYYRASARYLAQHPWQCGLAVLGVALGVAVVVAIDLANESARRAFELSTEAVTGRTTHQVIGGPEGLSEQVYERLRVEGRARPSAPVVSGYVRLTDAPEITLQLLGIDPFAEAPVRPYLGGRAQGSTGGGGRPVAGFDLAVLITQPATVVLSRHIAERLGLSVDDGFELDTGNGRHRVTVVGVLELADNYQTQAINELLVTDISTAQELLGMSGRLSRIDLVLPGGPAGDHRLAELRRLLPRGVRVLRAASRTAATEQMTRAFRVNLQALSLLALVCGMFLIYNTMTFSVVQRRRLIGIVRALGVTRGEVFRLVLVEAALIGVVGTIVGLVAGVGLGRGLVRLVAQTINDLYFVVTVTDVTVSGTSLARGAALGLGAAVMAALVPASEATKAPPVTVLTRSTLEQAALLRLPRGVRNGALLLLASLALLAVPVSGLWLSFTALFALLLGCAWLTPAITVAVMALVRPISKRGFGLLGGMASRGVVATLSRTGVAIATLMISVSVSIGIGVMVSSFRLTVERWLESVLRADLYVTVPSPARGTVDLHLDAALMRRLQTLPGVEQVDTVRAVSLETEEDRTLLQVMELRETGDAYRLKAGESAPAWTAWRSTDAVLVSEPYAYWRGLEIGGRVMLPTDRGTVAFPVVGIYYSYATDRGAVLMSRSTYERYWDDRGLSGVSLHLDSAADPQTIAEAVRRLFGSQQVIVQSSRALRRASLDVFDRTFLITGVLRMLVMVVAFLGILGALMALQLERAREFGVLRAMGFTPGQLWRLITAQTGLMGLVSGLLAIPVGLVLATVMIYVINRRSFGWTLQMQVQPEILLQALGLAVVAAIVAGLYPAARMALTSPAIALREE